MSIHTTQTNHPSKSMNISRSIYHTYLCLLLITGALLGCSDHDSNETEEWGFNEVSGKADGAAGPKNHEQSTYVETRFGIYTKIGEELLFQSQVWEGLQITEADEFAQPRMCAHNVSNVLEMSGLSSYSDYLVPHMLDAVKVRGGLVKQLDTRDKQGFIKSLNSMFNGHIPVGSLINGCLYRDCSGEGGDGHIAILGETDEDGVVYLYHNNWYRPDNEGGERRPFMVTEKYYDDHGLRRQWMKTPWIRIHRDVETDEIVDVEGLLPAIDDLDPFTGFFITVSILPEILQALNSPPVGDLFCPEGLTADAYLGACITGDAERGEVYGVFSDAMVKECIDRGYGRACSTQHTLEGDRYSISVYRWSKAVYKSLRGDDACAKGLYLDHDIGYCVHAADEELGTIAEAFGPFSRELVEECFNMGGGSGCASGRMSLEHLNSLLSLRSIQHFREP